MTGRWASSNRLQRLPFDWKRRVAATKRRAGGRCEGITFTGEPRWHVTNCDGIGTDCDHDQRGDNHDLSNLRWLSRPCHTAKTQREAQAAQPKRKREPEPHPGKIQ